MAWKPDYVTLVAQKNYMRITDPEHTLDTRDDVELAVAITAASRAIDKHCNRQFGLLAAVEERFYPAWYWDERCRWVLDIDDLMTSVGLVVTVDGTAVTDYTLEPRNAAAEGRPWERLVFGSGALSASWTANDYVSGVGRWGWSAVPTEVIEATYLQASRFHSRRNSPYGVAGSPDQGSEMRLLARVDPDVGVSLGDLRRPRKVG